MDAVRDLHAGDAAGFDAAYETDFGSWEALLRAVDWRPEPDYANEVELRDKGEFLRRCVDRYYGVANGALCRCDENHLFFGDRLNANTDTLDAVVEITSRHTDIIFYQAYGRYGDQEPFLDRWTGRVAQPFLNGDSTYVVATGMMPQPYGPLARDQAERAAWTREFGERAFARPDFVGWHIWGVINTWKTLPGTEVSQQSGPMTPTGDFYPEMEQAMRRLSSNL